MQVEKAQDHMDRQRKSEIRREVRTEFRLGRARLFRVEEEDKARGEIADDKARIFAAFKQLGQKRQLELTQCLGRLLMNFSKLASYRGVLEGEKIFRLGMELGSDRARFYLIGYLQERPDASFEELCAYLDRKNSRLSALRTSKDSPQWARIRPSWRKELQKLNLDPPPSEYELWRTALKKFPKRVEPYLSKTRKKAADTTIRNIFFAWPRIIREHGKQREP
jgi:hypothetical protein